MTADKPEGPATGVFDAVPDGGTFAALSPRLFVKKVCGRLWSTRRSVVVVGDFADRGDGRPPPARLDVSFVDPASFPDLSSTLQDASGADRLSLAAMERTRSEEAGELVVARSDGELVGFHFIHTAAHQERLERIAPRLYEPLEPGEALTEGLFVFPDFRGAGIARTMLRASAVELARRGYRRGIAVIDVENHASLRAFRAAGFNGQPVMRVDAYRFGRRTSRFAAVDRETWRRYRDAVV